MNLTNLDNTDLIDIMECIIRKYTRDETEISLYKLYIEYVGIYDDLFKDNDDNISFDDLHDYVCELMLKTLIINEEDEDFNSIKKGNEAETEEEYTILMESLDGRSLLVLNGN